MTEKRRTSARIKAEPPSNKRLSESTAERSAAAEKPAKPTAATKDASLQPKEQAALVLPTKIFDSKPLPTLPEPQPYRIPSSDYQTVKESGVLASSIARSRQAWTHGNLFEKYWSKTPAKKLKEMTEEEKAQVKANRGPPMTKVGPASLIIEPHVFDVTLFVVKDPAPGQKQGQSSNDRQFLQYGPAPGNLASPASSSSYRPPSQYQNPVPARAPSQVSPVAVQPPAHRIPNPHAQASTNPRHVTNVTASSAPKGQLPGPSQSTTPAIHNSSVAPPPAAPVSSPAPDPVIQALAQRASQNQELKSVMKIVATGKASPEQLAYFQKHIDELTQEVKARQEREAQRQNALGNVTIQPPTQAAQRKPTASQSAVVSQPSASTAYQNSSPAGRPGNVYYTHPTPPSTPRQRPMAAAPHPLHVLIQFSENGNDRFLFPKNSILEYLHGFSVVICSFLILVKGSGAVNESHSDTKTEYWQPVTVRFTGDVPTLNMLGRVVVPVDEARTYMEGVMSKYPRADEVSLALQLPKEQPNPGEVV